MTEPTIDSVSTAELIVSADDLASALALDSVDAFPAVLATARMVALMEIAAARLLRPYLATGQLSVGVSIDAVHTAPTPAGTKVTATARYLGREGKFFVFEVVAADAGGEIGRATHKRAIVDAQRLEGRAETRILAP